MGSRSSLRFGIVSDFLGIRASQIALSILLENFFRHGVTSLFAFRALNSIFRAFERVLSMTINVFTHTPTST